MVRHFYYDDVIQNPDYCLRELLSNIKGMDKRSDVDDGTVYELKEFGPYLFMNHDISECRKEFKYNSHPVVSITRMFMDGAQILKLFLSENTGKNINQSTQAILKDIPDSSISEEGYYIQEQSMEAKAVYHLAKTAFYAVNDFKKKHKVLEGALVDYSPIVEYMGTIDTTNRPVENTLDKYPSYEELLKIIKPTTVANYDMYYCLSAILLNNDLMVNDILNKTSSQLSQDILRIFNTPTLNIPLVYYTSTYICQYIYNQDIKPNEWKDVYEIMLKQYEAMAYLHTGTSGSLEKSLESFSLLLVDGDGISTVKESSKRFDQIFDKYSE